jgi:hypothetical protein
VRRGLLAKGEDVVVADVSIAGEHVVLFVAGVVGLAGIFLALLAVLADRRGWPYAWELGFAALLLASLAGVGSLWKVSGEVGLLFLIAALVIAGSIWGGLALFTRSREKAADRKGDGERACCNRDHPEQHERD